MARQYEPEEQTGRRVHIRRLLGKRLRIPLVAMVEPVNPGFVAHAGGISVFGYGDNTTEAIEVLKEGIENICMDDEFVDLRAAVQGCAAGKRHGGRKTAGPGQLRLQSGVIFSPLSFSSYLPAVSFERHLSLFARLCLYVDCPAGRCRL